MIAVLLVTPVFASVYTETFKTNTKKITMVKGEMLLPTIKGNKQSVKRTVTIKNEKTAKVVTSRNYIRALKKGTTSAVIKQGNKTLKVKLKVEDPKVVLADKKISLKGTTIKHKWKSSNPAVASVTGTGTITFKNSGSATLYTTIHGIKYQKNIYIVRNGSSFVIGKPGQKNNIPLVESYRNIVTWP